MFDEYQDTNTIQERILLLLAAERRNLCVVGDDEQGLYRFRGVTIRNVLEFPALFDAKEPPSIENGGTIRRSPKSSPEVIERAVLMVFDAKDQPPCRGTSRTARNPEWSRGTRK